MKAKLIEVGEYPFKMWSTYQEQTKMKHRVFKDYFDSSHPNFAL